MTGAAPFGSGGDDERPRAKPAKSHRACQQLVAVE